MTSRQLRLLRGATASSVATIIAAVSHTTGGGAPPHPLLVLALSVFLTPVAALLVGRTLSVGKLSVTVLLAQTIFHVLFVALGATLTTPGIATGHQHVMALGPLTSTVAPDAGMLGAHLLAAAVTIALLWRGERILRGIAHWVRAALRVRLPRLHSDWPVPASCPETAPAFVAATRTSDVSRRGPPVFSCG
ncbi:hypothetical protein [Microbacterium sp. A93]|uniref:hypothetical protein n=1 Tax=Microbacterium sp. A93 TaxID=3450716 RepID=UPI003F429639